MENDKDNRELRDYITDKCKHEYRQLRFNPQYISRNYQVRFYCIFCLYITDEIEIDK